MGMLTYQQMKDRLEFNLGNQAFDEDRLGLWIHDGYYDLAGAFDFAELNKTATATIDGGNDAIIVPADMQWPRALTNQTDDFTLIYEDQANFLRRDLDTEGQPQYWTRLGDSFRVWPTAEVDTLLRVLYNKFPTPLADDLDVSALLPTYDKAILLFSESHALYDTKENAMATDVLARAMNYVRSRLLPEEFQEEGVSLGLTHASSLSDIGAART